MKGSLITFEGTEGSGKSTQLSLLEKRLLGQGWSVRAVREPGGTPIGEEIRHTLKHSAANEAMTAEAELLLMNASRAQLVREVIRPALAKGQMVLCDRFYDSTTAYQGYGRGLDLKVIDRVIEFAVGETRPDLTLLLLVPPDVSAARLLARQSTMPFVRDRLEEADASFFERVARGYRVMAAAEPRRVKLIDAAGRPEEVQEAVWRAVEPMLRGKGE
ncbi:MAG: dTMP kinase [Limisphaerales bacterium]